MNRFTGNTAIVTGGAQGIGAAIVLRLARDGARVSFLDIDAARGHALAADLQAQGLDVRFIPADVTIEDDIRRAVESSESVFGPVDILVNNAGRNAYFDAAEMSSADWDSSMALNLKAAWLCAKYVLPSMKLRGGGSIVNISSLHARLTTEGMFPYAAAKAGLTGLTRSLALDYGAFNIRVNAILPGWTRTAAVDDWLSRQPDPAAAERQVIDAQPLRRIASTAEVANVAAFLASDESSAITGAEIAVDCGLGAKYAG
ncbi:MAG: short-chain dehydrogenase [Candidatus Solibacter sp.]|nr:short-chain dehydrogenase [Candidatus Solibacter sp.]